MTNRKTIYKKDEVRDSLNTVVRSLKVAATCFFVLTVCGFAGDFKFGSEALGAALICLAFSTIFETKLYRDSVRAAESYKRDRSVGSAYESVADADFVNVEADNCENTHKSNVKRLYKSRTDRKFDGVCGGIAEYLNVDSSIVRLFMILLAGTSGIGIIVYLVADMVMDEEPTTK